MTDLDPLSSFLLSSIDYALDKNGADEWPHLWIAAASCAFFGSVKLVMRKKYNIEWYGFLHAIVTGLGAVAVLYLDVFASESLTGIPEPLASATCRGSLTSLHRVLPPITMGFALIDIVDSFHIGIDFVVHGIATFSVMAFFVAEEKPHVVAPFLLMEVSTIFLSLVRADFSDTFLFVNQLLFSLSFFLCRIAIMPVFHYRLTKAMFFADGSDCHPNYFRWAVLFFGIFFDCLNSFWFYKLVRKMRRKLMGIEKVKSKNDDLREFSQEQVETKKKE